MKRRTVKTGSFFDVLAMPHPFRAWLCISNDPDNTTIENWQQLHHFIWEELRLPVGDALFIKSLNQNLPGQVNLTDHPQILSAHKHDSLHFWGDYQNSRKEGFDREDAEKAEKILREKKFTPRVWVDHANHQANFLHSHSQGTIPIFKDSAGIEYKNYNYTLDIAERIGVRYIWNGTITKYAGQDFFVSYFSYLKALEVPLSKAVIFFLLRKLFSTSQLIAGVPPAVKENAQYWSRQFPDGRTLYSFIRFGSWEDADIDGLANVISAENIRNLIAREGTCIAYTHLGKRKPNRFNDADHIPATTKIALKNISKEYKEKNLKISPISEMLDYLVIRDNILLNEEKPEINFVSDGIRFEKLTPEDLKPHGFSFYMKFKGDIPVLVDGTPVAYGAEINNTIITIHFK